MRERTKKVQWQDIAVALFFVVFLMYGLSIVKDYSGTSDEWIERTTGLINYKEIFQLQDQTIGNVDFGALPELSEYRDRYYGVVAQYIPLLVEHYFGFELTPYHCIQLRHLFTFGLFWLACICFYFLCRLLGSTKGEGLLGVAFLVLSPRIFADAFYNIKDSVFLSMMVFNLYAGLVFLKRPGMLRGLILAAISAICINVRVLGAEVIALCLAAFLIEGIQKKQFGLCVLLAIMTTVVGIGIYILITPVAWGDFFGAVKGILSKFSNYTSWSGYNFYNGEALHAWELPRHYLPVWIAVTTPVLYLVFAAAGIPGLVKACIHRKLSSDRIIIVLYVLVPFLYVILRKPSLYNGWRHFYFLYPGIVLASVYGLRQIKKMVWKHAWLKGTAIGILSVYLVVMGNWLVKNHPFECLYFNMPSRSYAAENLDKDYWLVSAQESLYWVAANEPKEKFSLYGAFTSYLPEGTLKNRIISAKEREYVIYSNISSDESERFDGNFLSEKAGECDYAFDGFELYDEVHRIEVDGICVSKVYHRTHNKKEGSVIQYEAGSLWYDLSGVFWSLMRDGDGVIINGELAEPQECDRIGIQSNGDILPEQIEVSEDGIHWNVFMKSDTLVRDDSRLQINMEAEFVKYIRLIFLEAPEDFEMQVGFYAVSDMGETWKNHPYGVLGGSASSNAGLEGFALDGDIDTRWDSGAAQAAGMTFVVELTETQVIGGVSLDCGEYSEDYPRGIVFYGSEDGEMWTEMKITGTKDDYYQLESMPVRYLKMELTEECACNWSICELRLWNVD